MNRWLNFREINIPFPSKPSWALPVKYLRRRGIECKDAARFTVGQRTDAFNVDLRNNGFTAFLPSSCGVLDLVVAMERCSLRQAGVVNRMVHVTAEVRHWSRPSTTRNGTTD